MLHKIAALRGLRHLGKHILEQSFKDHKKFGFHIKNKKVDIFCPFRNRPKIGPYIGFPKGLIYSEKIFFIEFKTKLSNPLYIQVLRITRYPCHF